MAVFVWKKKKKYEPAELREDKDLSGNVCQAAAVGSGSLTRQGRQYKWREMEVKILLPECVASRDDQGR